MLQQSKQQNDPLDGEFSEMDVLDDANSMYMVRPKELGQEAQTATVVCVLKLWHSCISCMIKSILVRPLKQAKQVVFCNPQMVS